MVAIMVRRYVDPRVVEWSMHWEEHRGGMYWLVWDWGELKWLIFRVLRKCI